MNLPTSVHVSQFSDCQFEVNLCFFFPLNNNRLTFICQLTVKPSCCSLSRTIHLKRKQQRASAQYCQDLFMFPHYVNYFETKCQLIKTPCRF